MTNFKIIIDKEITVKSRGKFIITERKLYIFPFHIFFLLLHNLVVDAYLDKIQNLSHIQTKIKNIKCNNMYLFNCS